MYLELPFTKPLIDSDAGVKPLGNQEGSNLAGLFKIKLKKVGIRVFYKLKREGEEMTIIIISARINNAEYLEAGKRREKHKL